MNQKLKVFLELVSHWYFKLLTCFTVELYVNICNASCIYVKLTFFFQKYLSFLRQTQSKTRKIIYMKKRYRSPYLVRKSVLMTPILAFRVALEGTTTPLMVISWSANDMDAMWRPSISAWIRPPARASHCVTMEQVTWNIVLLCLIIKLKLIHQTLEASMKTSKDILKTSNK